MNFSSLMLLVLGFSLQSGHAVAEEISLAKAAELGCHRIERLVTLKRIDEAFLNKFYGVKIEKMNADANRFRFRGFQSQGRDGTSKQVEILMDENGKATSHSVVDGPEAVAPGWPQKDPVSLLETAMHYILDNPAKPEVAPFFNAFAEGALAQVDIGGEVHAKAAFRTSASSQVMEIVLKMDGTLVGVTVK